MTTYSIKKACEDNIDQITDIQKKVLKENFEPILGKEKADKYIEIKAFENFVEHNCDNFDLLLNKTDIIGFAFWENTTLKYFSIIPEHQGTIAGLYFLKSLCYDKFKDNDELDTICLKKNEQAIKFLEKCGWRKDKSANTSTDIELVKYTFKIVNRETIKDF